MRRARTTASALMLVSAMTVSGCQLLVQMAPRDLSAPESAPATPTPAPASQDPTSPEPATPQPSEILVVPTQADESLPSPTMEVPPPRN